MIKACIKITHQALCYIKKIVRITLLKTILADQYRFLITNTRKLNTAWQKTLTNTTTELIQMKINYVLLIKRANSCSNPDNHGCLTTINGCYATKY